MPGRRTTELTTTASLSNDDLLYVVDVSATTGEKSKGITKSDLAALIGTSAASSSPIENEYADITALLADQGNQTTSFLQYVVDASDDPNIASGDAYYEKKATSTTTFADDYRLLSDTETTVVVNSNNYRTLKIQDVSATSVTSVSGGKVSFEYTGANATAIIFNKLMTDALIDFYATDVDIVFYNKGSKKYETESIASGAWTTVNTDYYRGAFTGTKIQTADLTSADDLDFFIMPSATGGGGSGTVTSVAQTVPTGFTVSGSPITTSGTLAISYDTGYEGFTTAQKNDIKTEYLMFAVSDETTDLAVATGVITFRMPYAMTLTGVRASVVTAPTGSALTVDINEGGTTILSTKLTIDANEKTSTTAATPPVISDSALADDAEITVDIDAIGSTVAGAGLKITLIGERA